MNRVYALAAGAALSALIVSTADAAFIVTAVESGGNVVVTGSGTIDTTGLTSVTPEGVGPTFFPSIAEVLLGNKGFAEVEQYTGISGPTSFGSFNGNETPTSGSGDDVGISGNYSQILLPSNYVSGAELSDTDTWAGARFVSLGLTQGLYVYTWGTGSDADSFTVEIGSPVPEPAALAVFGLPALVGLLRRRRTTRCAQRGPGAFLSEP
jgi:uncharacterized protein (TIGR03382 family)